MDRRTEISFINDNLDDVLLIFITQFQHIHSLIKDQEREVQMDCFSPIVWCFYLLKKLNTNKIPERFRDDGQAYSPTGLTFL
jgi:hypothetical protein